MRIIIVGDSKVGNALSSLSKRAYYDHRAGLKR